MKRIILTTGGTGGHIFPALAVAEEIRRKFPAAQILFLGSEHGPEADMAAKAGLDFAGLPARGIVGRGGRGVLAAFGLVPCLVKAAGIMRKFKPEAVLGFGGYASFAGVTAAKLLGIPVAIHEQNSISGLTNRLSGKFAKKIFLSLPDAVGAFPKGKSVLVGNPVRSSIVELYDRLNQGKTGHSGPPRLLIMGGSQGARAINNGVMACLPALLEAGIEIRHQTGAADYERIREKYREEKAEHVRVEAFINDMQKAYAWADMALCRAGGTSMAEMMAAALPAVLVPLPTATHNHQYYNAKTLEREGAAITLEQKEFAPPDGKPEALSKTVIALINDKAKLSEMSARCRMVAKPDAAASVVDGLVELLKRPLAGQNG